VPCLGVFGRRNRSSAGHFGKVVRRVRYRRRRDEVQSMSVFPITIYHQGESTVAKLAKMR
jgi:hypothetical protein